MAGTPADHAPARILFMGTGDIALPAFRWLAGRAIKPVALVTQPGRPAGRRREIREPALKAVAQAVGIPVLQPERIRDREALQELEALAPDLIVVMAYGQILPRALIRMPRLACVNLHASLLPKYRGAACIQAAIDAGDSETGITLLDIAEKLDAGDVIASASLSLGPEDTGGSVHDQLADLAAELVREWLPRLLAGSAPRTPQAEMGEASYVPKLERDDGRLSWTWPAVKIERRIRAYDPWPGTWCEEIPATKRVKIFPGCRVVEAAGVPGSIQLAEGRVIVSCGSGGLELSEVQPEGSRRMDALDWWRGKHHPDGRPLQLG